MTPVRPLLLVIFAILTAAASGRAAVALTTLYNFEVHNAYSHEDRDAPLIQAADGLFYGTTRSNEYAADFGTVFRLNADGTVTILHRFDGDDGKDPGAALLQAAEGNFYGTTNARGGTVFRLTPDGVFTTIYEFDSGYSLQPSALVQGTDGNFYGTTIYGGDENVGTVFRLTSDGTLTILHSFDASSKYPSSGLIQGADGTFYGTTAGFGPDHGTIFRVTPDGGGFTTLHRFDGIDGIAPVAALVEGRDGFFYGTTAEGSTLEPGHVYALSTVFRLSSKGKLTILHTFGRDGGVAPYAGLVQGPDGNFYGTTRGDNELASPPDAGTVFRITPGGELTTLRRFDGLDGAHPSATLIESRAGDLYGLTSRGGVGPVVYDSGIGYSGTDGNGTIFRLTVTAAPAPPVVTAHVVGPTTLLRGHTDTTEFRLTLASAPTVPVRVAYSVAGSARPGVDFVELSGTVKIKAGKTSQSIKLTSLQANGAGKKVVRFQLLPGNGYTLGTDAPLKVKLLAK